MGKYVPVRFPLEAYENFMKKKEKIEQDIRKERGVDLEVPLTNIILEASKQPLFLDQAEMHNLAKRRWKK